MKRSEDLVAGTSSQLPALMLQRYGHVVFQGRVLLVLLQHAFNLQRRDSVPGYAVQHPTGYYLMACKARESWFHTVLGHGVPVCLASGLYGSQVPALSHCNDRA